jgi:hypothetical protein
VRRRAWPALKFLLFTDPGIYRVAEVLVDESGTERQELRVARNSDFAEAEWVADDWQIYDGSGPKEPVAIQFETLGLVNDDISLMVDGQWISDTRIDGTFFNGPRRLSVVHPLIRAGAVVQVFVCNTIGDWSGPAWLATVLYGNGRRVRIGGGGPNNGDDSGAASFPVYHYHGEFVVPEI